MFLSTIAQCDERFRRGVLGDPVDGPVPAVPGPHAGYARSTIAREVLAGTPGVQEGGGGHQTGLHKEEARPPDAQALHARRR